MTAPLLHPHAARVTISGGLEPNPEVVARLRREIDPRLGLRFIPAVDRFAVVCAWHEHDPRRGLVNTDPDSAALAHGVYEDILCVLPISLSTDDVPAYLMKLLRNHASADYRALADAMRAHNSAASDANFAPVRGRAIDKIEVLVGNRVSPTFHMSDTESRTSRVSDEALQPVERRS